LVAGPRRRLAFRLRVVWVVRCSFLLLITASVAMGAAVPTPQDWTGADQATVRLKPSAFRTLSIDIQRYLNECDCTVPQAYATTIPHNVIRGHFTLADRIDVAVLCSRNRVSSILVFGGGMTTSVTQLAPEPDVDLLRIVVPEKLVFARALGVASPSFIRRHNDRYAGPKPPQLDHDGINDEVVVAGGSVVWYWYDGRWLKLPGND
jgi:hypothetical protein